MRNLFFLLVLANLGFAAWHSWYARPPGPAHAADSDLPGLTLVSEVPPDIAHLRDANAVVPDVHLPSDEPAAASAPPEPRAAAGAETHARAAPPPSPEPPAPASPRGGPAPGPAAVAPAPTTTASAAATPRCTTVGPFRELAQAATAAASLRTAGYQPTQRVAEGDVWIGYWVYIDAISTEAEANAILAKVRGEGVTDSYVIPNSDSGNLVSLGVFSEISGVARRREQVRSLGYDPKVVDRTRRATVYWVDIQLAADQTLDFDALQTPGRIQRLEQRNCDAPAR
ncbi:MAG TPA: SPOR domain-containing protein [Gammaproteobacteria bacterium]|nr:SPOR domain-containing protein [Gammaproteobacteria bacterium]